MSGEALSFSERIMMNQGGDDDDDEEEEEGKDDDDDDDDDDEIVPPRWLMAFNWDTEMYKLWLHIVIKDSPSLPHKSKFIHENSGITPTFVGEP